MFWLNGLGNEMGGMAFFLTFVIPLLESMGKVYSFVQFDFLVQFFVLRYWYVCCYESNVAFQAIPQIIAERRFAYPNSISKPASPPHNKPHSNLWLKQNPIMQQLRFQASASIFCPTFPACLSTRTKSNVQTTFATNNFACIQAIPFPEQALGPRLNG